jgi:hypothetical protein
MRVVKPLPLADVKFSVEVEADASPMHRMVERDPTWTSCAGLRIKAGTRIQPRGMPMNTCWLARERHSLMHLCTRSNDNDIDLIEARRGRP